MAGAKILGYQQVITIIFAESSSIFSFKYLILAMIVFHCLLFRMMKMQEY